MTVARVPMLCLLAFIVLPLILSTTVTPAEAFIISDIIDAIVDVPCLKEHQDAAKVCVVLVSPLFLLQSAFQENEQKEICCARNVAYQCIGLVNDFFCGDIEYQKNQDPFSKASEEFVPMSECKDYEILDQCTDYSLFFLIILGYLLLVAMMFLIIKFILRRLFKMCC